MYSLAQILQNWALIYGGGLLGTGVLIWIHETHPPLRVHRYEPVNADQTEQVAAANRGRERKGPHADGALQMHAEG